MINPEGVTGVVLAGGKSTRMGRDKALMILDGKPFIQHVAEALHAVFTEVIISANSRDYDFLCLPVIKDVYPDCGPLGGIHAGLASLNTSSIFIATCDAPLLIPAIVETLLAEAEAAEITIASSPRGFQPLVGMYPTCVRSAMQDFLESGQRKVMEFLATVGFRTVRRDAWAKRLQNINDMSQYRGLLRQRGSSFVYQQKPEPLRERHCQPAKEPLAGC